MITKKNSISIPYRDALRGAKVPGGGWVESASFKVCGRIFWECAPVPAFDLRACESPSYF